MDYSLDYLGATIVSGNTRKAMQHEMRGGSTDDLESVACHSRCGAQESALRSS